MASQENSHGARKRGKASRDIHADQAEAFLGPDLKDPLVANQNFSEFNGTNGFCSNP
jgi:hypothetical protein